MDKSSQNQTVMVVDDADDIRDLVRFQVSMLGYHVVEAANGHEAIELILARGSQTNPDGLNYAGD